MAAPLLADVQLTGAAAGVLLYGLVLAGGVLIFAIARTSPRRRSTQPLSGVELQIQLWLWRRHRSREAAILGATAALGAVGCMVSSLLPVATYTAYAMYPGDPFAGVQEIEATVKGLALFVGAIVALLSVRRALGGEAITAPICLLLATLLVYFTGFAIADVISNAATGPSQYTSGVMVGPGLFALPAAALMTWLACAADVALGARDALRLPHPRAASSPPSEPPLAPPSQPPLPPPLSPPLAPPSAPLRPPRVSGARNEFGDARLVAQSVASGVVLIIFVIVGWLPAVFLIFGLLLTGPNVVAQLYVGRRLDRRFRIDRASVAIVAASVLALAAALGWAVLRPDSVLIVPASARHVGPCDPSVTVPDVGNQVNRSIAGNTTFMTVGSKIYVEDSPVGSAALTALTLDGQDIVCAAGGSGFGEVVVATSAGEATLYVRTTDNVTYRIQVQVRS